MKTKSLLSTPQLADALNVSTRTIRKWQASKVIPFFKVKRCVRFDLEKVMEALEAFECKTSNSFNQAR